MAPLRLFSILPILLALSSHTHASPSPNPLPIPAPAPVPAPDPGLLTSLLPPIIPSIVQNLESILDKASNGSLASGLAAGLNAGAAAAKNGSFITGIAAGLAAFIGQHGSVVWQNGFLELGMMGIGGRNGTNGTMNGTGVVMGGGKDMQCPRMSVIFARGTGEPGNVGILTGPPFFAALAEYMNGTNQLAIQGVSYEAQPAGFFAGGSMNGAAKMASLTTLSLTLCPSTPILLSGYSQGAQLIHLAVSMLPPATTSKITSIVMFGDPKNGTMIPGVDERRVRTFCHAGDDICKGGSGVSGDHLNYVRDVNEAARWGMQMIGGEAGLGIVS